MFLSPRKLLNQKRRRQKLNLNLSKSMTNVKVSLDNKINRFF